MSKSIPAAVLMICVSLFACAAGAATIPLRCSLPAVAEDEVLPGGMPVCGGVPLPASELTSADNVRLLGLGGKELPCQVAAAAWWPDGSVKWVLVDAVIAPDQFKALRIEYGPNVKRASVPGGVEAAEADNGVTVSGGGVDAAIGRSGTVMDRCTLGGKPVVAEGAPARLVIDALRIPEGTSGQALSVNTFVCRDPKAKLSQGTVHVEQLSVESPGPIRATVLMRGYVELPGLGATLPPEAIGGDVPGRLPFSLRLSFYRDCPVVFGQHQIIYTGEPDCDYITHWAIELPGQGARRGRLEMPGGAEVDVAGGKATLNAEPSRLCWAPLKSGFALIRQGWQSSPCAVTGDDDSAMVEFWPAQAGPWDLRRYAREWAVGGTGDTTDPAIMANFAKYAARGVAKSHDFVICAAGAAGAEPLTAVRALSGKAILVAQPQWYSFTEALGPMAPEATSGPLAPIDARMRRRADYYLYCQDLFNWYGKTTYGFWQTRYGQMHRIDRWDRDYGRWGWSLNDGAGRIGHALMLEFLRTLDRRYFDAGEAFARIDYDTNMVHVDKHIEVPSNWWQVKGNSHRHDAQPYSETYIGMRGSYPVDKRILDLLTGDGVIADGLEIVAATSLGAGEGHGGLCHSGGSDGQGSAANALLWKYETTGDDRYLKACRNILDDSELVPPPSPRSLGYGPSFGLFNAAGEYALLSGDKEFQQRVIKLGQMGAEQKSPNEFISAIAVAVKLSGDAKLRSRLVEILTGIAGEEGESLAELPAARWPGHAGFRTAMFDANFIRDYAVALGVLKPPGRVGEWPKAVAAVKAAPAELPEGWYRPAGGQTAAEDVPSADKLAALAGAKGGGKTVVGDATLEMSTSLCDKVDVKGASPLAGGIVPYVELVQAGEGGLPAASSFQTFRGQIDSIGPAGQAIVATGQAGPARLRFRLTRAAADGVPSLRVEASCTVPPDSGQVASWGLLIPLKLASDGHMIQTTAPARFRVERTRLDQNDERIETWLTSEYHWPDIPGYPLWPKWRVSGIDVGPGTYYRVWKGNAEDVCPTVCDEGKGFAAWFDVTDRGAKPRWGLTVRLLQPQPLAAATNRQTARVNLETGLMQVQFHSAAAGPLSAEAATAGLAGAADIIFHDGWRPPLGKPELTAQQYEKFLDDLDYGGNYGLLAYRFCLSIDHRVQGRQWVEKIRDLGVEPRELLYGMLWRDGLADFCKRIGVAWDPGDVEASVARVVEYYRK